MHQHVLTLLPYSLKSDIEDKNEVKARKTMLIFRWWGFKKKNVRCFGLGIHSFGKRSDSLYDSFNNLANLSINNYLPAEFFGNWFC